MLGHLERHKTYSVRCAGTCGLESRAVGKQSCDAQGLVGSGAVPSGRTVRCTGTDWLEGQVVVLRRRKLRAMRRDLAAGWSAKTASDAQGPSGTGAVQKKLCDAQRRITYAINPSCASACGEVTQKRKNIENQTQLQKPIKLRKATTTQNRKT